MDIILQKIFFNFFIRLSYETLIEVSLTAMVVFYDIRWDTQYQVCDSLVAMCTIAAFIIFAVSIPIFLTCKSDQLASKQFQQKYGSLVLDLRIKNTSVRFYYMLFVLRRLSLSALIVFVNKWSLMQVQVICIINLAQLVYICWAWPYMFNWMNWLEMANEFLVHVSAYFLFVYSDGLLLVEHPKVDWMVKDHHFAN